MAATKEEQGRIKDVGGFVGGYLSKGRRDKTSVLYRTLITLDADFSNANLWWNFTLLFDCAAVIHSTHKSGPNNIRHRLIIPACRELNPEEYQAVSRKIAEILGISLFDPSTFDVNRLMFWPSMPCDSDYYFKYQDGPILDPDSILSKYNDWHDITEWPRPDSIDNNIAVHLSNKQEDPVNKKGLIGLFCREYTVSEAIEKFLSDEYAKVGDNRYTYLKGTTSAGLILYEDKFAYSHHGTDPAGGRLCNAFDLVRIHKFGYLDDSDDSNKKSMRAMEGFIVEEPRCKKRIASEKFAEARFEFSGVSALNNTEGASPTQSKADGTDDKWLTELTINTKGEYENTANNINLILSNDPNIKGLFILNSFDNKRYLSRKSPWRDSGSGQELFKDADYSGVRSYLECIYGIVSVSKIDDALALEFEKNRFHPVVDYLRSLVWDGIPRIDTLLIEYFGAEDTIYSRAAIRKSLCAAVARVLEPGIKFDNILILVGKQGTYKSTFVKKLGRKWFSDTFLSVQGKESYEQLQGAWIIEIAELAGLKKAEVETIKHFASKSVDSFRPAYGRVVESFPRQCIFMGTTNSHEFLRDPTGNRRFIPIDVRPEHIVKSVIYDLTDNEINQIWAEAYHLYTNGEPLYFNPEELRLAAVAQEEHSEADSKTGLVENFLEMKYPKNWDTMDMYDRRAWLGSPLSKKGDTYRYDVCAAEIWCECFSGEVSDLRPSDLKDLNTILSSLPGWKKAPGKKNFSLYGKQSYYTRINDLL
jgi:predicted P-loop ATPase